MIGAIRSILIFAVAAALGMGGTAQAADPVKVVATFSIIGNLVKEVGAETVQVRTLVRPGGDAHVYQPTPSDAKAIAGADLVVVNGLGMEGWLDRLIKASGYKGPVAVASKGVKTQTMEEEEGGAGKAKVVIDPHAWQNLANGQIYVRNIADALAMVDPANATGDRQRAATFGQELKTLDTWVRQQVGQVPAAKRKIIRRTMRSAISARPMA